VVSGEDVPRYSIQRFAGHGLLRYSAPSGGFTSGERPGEVCLGSQPWHALATVAMNHEPGG